MSSQIGSLTPSNITFISFNSDNKKVENADNVNDNTIDRKFKNDIFEISKSASSSKLHIQDIIAVKKAKAEENIKYSSLQNLANNLFQKQGKVGLEVDWDILVETGKLEGSLKNIKVDMSTKLRAQSDISENGYWGIKNTSSRIVEFAKSLTGGDSSKADKMFEALKKGYLQAVDAFGGKDIMPSICQSTYDEVVKKFDEWKNSTENQNKIVLQM